MNTLLTDVEKAGGSGILPAHATKQEREALELHLWTLRQQGHAVVADEVIEFGDFDGAIRIVHYKNCLMCSCGMRNRG